MSAKRVRSGRYASDPPLGVAPEPILRTILASDTTGQRGSWSMGTSDAIPQFHEVGGDRGVQLCGFLLLRAQRRSEPLHLLVERLAVVLNVLRADVASRREDVAVFADVVEPRG